MSDIGLGSWPMRRARMSADMVALRQAGRVLTYGQLARRVDTLASALAARGVRQGDRIAYLGPNDIATFETFFAAGRLGAVFVALNTRLSGAEITYMLADSGSTVLVHSGETAALAAAAEPYGSGVRTVVSLDPTAALPGAVTYESLFAATDVRLPERQVALNDDALLLYTSGTTGRPKGAILSHGNLTFNTMNQLAHVDVLGNDVALCIAPLFHVTGLGLVSMPVLFKGGTLVVAPKFDPAWVLRVIAEERITAFSAVPTMLQMLAEHPDWSGANLRSLRYVIYGGSPVNLRIARAWQERGVEILQGYGMTEAAPGIVMALPEGAADRPGSTGVPHFFTDNRVVDAGGRCIYPPAEGELLVRGPNVFRGYWKRPDESAASFDGEWFRTGDVVRYDSNGWTYVVGRVKDMFISGGENVYPAEVESVIAQLPEVADSAVIGVPDERWGEVGAAFVLLKVGTTLDEEQLRRHLNDRLARYKIPRYVRFVDQLPRTASGKVRKAYLRTTFTDRSTTRPEAEERA
ncbi:long-chain fatty acid--CoA ligase [Micromonospora sp. NPDC047707]|uniref:acyl-CoA synthetase n=1 Tax=Micromonospora sp. NPDC047707 TaxID=3154498 RepID=UPI0034570904